MSEASLAKGGWKSLHASAHSLGSPKEVGSAGRPGGAAGAVPASARGRSRAQALCAHAPAGC